MLRLHAENLADSLHCHFRQFHQLIFPRYCNGIRGNYHLCHNSLCDTRSKQRHVNGLRIELWVSSQPAPLFWNLSRLSRDGGCRRPRHRLFVLKISGAAYHPENSRCSLSHLSGLSYSHGSSKCLLTKHWQAFYIFTGRRISVGESEGLGVSSRRNGYLYSNRRRLCFAGADNCADFFPVWLTQHHAVAVGWRRTENFVAKPYLSEDLQLDDGSPFDGFAHPGIYRAISRTYRIACCHLQILRSVNYRRLLSSRRTPFTFQF